MANYFPVALTGMAQSWLMNLPEGTLDSWPELYHHFTTNFDSAYSTGKRDRPPRHATAPGGISALLHPAVLLGSEHHFSYFQCFYCSCISPGCEG
jgi:hypothetical protein